MLTHLHEIFYNNYIVFSKLLILEMSISNMCITRVFLISLLSLCITVDMVHRDLKLENILLSTDKTEEPYNIKVYDII